MNDGGRQPLELQLVGLVDARRSNLGAISVGEIVDEIVARALRRLRGDEAELEVLGGRGQLAGLQVLRLRVGRWLRRGGYAGMVTRWLRTAAGDPPEGVVSRGCEYHKGVVAQWLRDRA